MNPQERIQITSQHQDRLAVVYVRRATVPSGDRDQANLEYQRAQRQHAHRWGWSPDKVQVIEDIGRGGTDTAHRTGFQTLCGMIGLGQVGLVLVSDIPRLGRSWRDPVAVVRLCQKADTLVAVDGRLVDLSTIFGLDSSPAQLDKDTGSLTYQRSQEERIREIVRRYGAGETPAEIAAALNTGGLETTGPA